LTYIGALQTGSPSGPVTLAYGNLFPSNFQTFDPLYRFDLDLSPLFGFPFIAKSNFWVLTTAGDGTDISAIVTMSCDLNGGDQQLFYLSREPYFVPPVTFDLLESQVKRAILNYDQFNISGYFQAQGRLFFYVCYLFKM
jgi:hypothetical protein